MYKFGVGDVVRFDFTDEYVGLYEVSGYNINGLVSVSNNFGDSDLYAKEEWLVLVCKSKDRLDI